MDDVLSPACLDELPARLRLWKKLLDLPGLGFVLVSAGRENICVSLGLADRKTEAPFDEKTILPVGSLTKAFTTYGLSLLVEAGTLEWDVPVRRFIPEFRLARPQTPREMTLQDLLCHGSGLGDMPVLYGGNKATVAAILDRLSQIEPCAEVGQRFIYSNMNYLLAGEVGARAAGMPWIDFVTSRVIHGLGLPDTTMGQSPDPERQGHARGYGRSHSGRDWIPVPPLPFKLCAAAGGLETSMEGLAVWIRFLLGNVAPGQHESTKPACLGPLFKPHMSLGPGLAYGLGWKLSRPEGQRLIHHEGNVPGYCATLGLLPDEEMGYALICNVSDTCLQQRIHHDISVALASDAGRRVFSGPRCLPAPAPDLHRSVCPLHLRTPEGGGIYTVFEDRQFLFLEMPGQPPVQLVGPLENGLYQEESAASLTLKLPQDLSDPTQEAALVRIAQYHGQRLAGLPPSVDPLEPPEVEVSGLDPFIGRYRLELSQVVVEIHPEKKVTIVRPDHTESYPLKGPDERERWRLDSHGLQSIRLHAGSGGGPPSLIWSVVQVDRLRPLSPDAALPSADALLELRHRAEGRFRTMMLAKLRLTGHVSYPQQGIEGRVQWLLSEGQQELYREDLGIFGSSGHLRRGSRFWSSDRSEDIRELTGVELDDCLASRESEQAFMGNGEWRQVFRHLRVLERTLCAGRKAYRVWCQPLRGAPVTRFVEEETGLLLKEEAGAICTTFSDFRSVGGAQLPFLMTSVSSTPFPDSRVIRFEMVEAAPSLDRDDFTLDQLQS